MADRPMLPGRQPLDGERSHVFEVAVGLIAVRSGWPVCSPDVAVPPLNSRRATVSSSGAWSPCATSLGGMLFNSRCRSASSDIFCVCLRTVTSATCYCYLQAVHDLFGQRSSHI